MTLEWFKPDLLLIAAPALRPLWMNNYRQFVLELQTNFGSHSPVGDAEHQLDHLTMMDGQQITKYIVEFNCIASQIRGYEEGALWHHFYNGIPNCIKDEISHVGKSTMLFDLRQLAQAINVHYWEHKSEVSCQTKPTSVPSTSRNSPNTTPTMFKDTKKSKGKVATTSGTSANNPDLTSKLNKDGKLTTVERKYHFNNKLCVFCSLAGHMTKDCPKSTSRASKGRTVMITLEAKLDFGGKKLICDLPVSAQSGGCIDPTHASKEIHLNMSALLDPKSLMSSVTLNSYDIPSILH